MSPLITVAIGFSLVVIVGGVEGTGAYRSSGTLRVILRLLFIVGIFALVGGIEHAAVLGSLLL